jgi:ACS family tartrate transporter-like MFS transporter
MRFLLGVAEAGFFPGMILYLTYWFPAAQRAKAIAFFMTAGATALAIGGPIGGALLRLDGLHGLQGWQWLFFLEGIPSVILGVLTLFVLTDRPEAAAWLPDDERRWLLDRLATERAAQGERAHLTLGQAFRFPLVWLLAGIYVANVIGGYGVSMWLPQIIKGWGAQSDFANAALSGLPYLLGSVPGLLLIGRHSDRAGERRLHVLVPYLLAAMGLVLSAMFTHPVLGILAISLALFGIWGSLSPFWAMSSGLLSGTAAAGAIALINSVGSLGGFIGPFGVGWIRDRTGGNRVPLLVLAGVLIVGAVLVSRVPARAARKDALDRTA